MFLLFKSIYMPKVKVRYYFITEILTIKEYWNLIFWETFLAMTWEPNVSQACSFHRMLINHQNFHFTQIPDKTNDGTFLKSPKTIFLGHFWPFLPNGGIFQKNPVVTHNYIWAPNTMLNFRKNEWTIPEKTYIQKERQTEGRTGQTDPFYRTLLA